MEWSEGGEWDNCNSIINKYILKSYYGCDRVNRESGTRGHAIFGQKLLNTQHSVGRCTYKSPIMKWAKMLKESSKKFTEAKCNLSQQHQLVH